MYLSMIREITLLSGYWLRKKEVWYSCRWAGPITECHNNSLCNNVGWFSYLVLHNIIFEHYIACERNRGRGWIGKRNINRWSHRKFVEWTSGENIRARLKSNKCQRVIFTT